MLTKSETNYRPADNPTASCATCENFIGPDACRIVEGLIDPADVSDEHLPFESTAAPAGPIPAEGDPALAAQLFGGPNG